ncbi:MAG: ATP-binding protein, partial [Bacteroidota bacterium]|nr:ATP-binding protein [Bacteroidota bacterium]
MDGNYSEENIKTLEWKEHIRLRPGMYIGKLGDGSSLDDGIYVLLKEVMDNAVDEYMMGFGRKIDVSIVGSEVRVRDFGRGIPLGKVLDVSSRMNTGAKYDSKAFKKSVGLNGVGIKAVNALSSSFIIRSFRDGQAKEIEFRSGELIRDEPLKTTGEENGTEVIFTPDEAMFGNYHFISEYVESMMKNYSYLNAGMIINLNGNKIISRNGLVDLLNDNMNREGLYPIIHLKGEDIEVAITHGMQYGEDYYSFVNGQHTSQGGTHLIAFREAITRTVKEFFKKDFDAADIRSSIIAAISVKIEEPIFESQTKTKLGSKDMGPNGPSVRNYVVDFIRKNLDDYLHKNGETAR